MSDTITENKFKHKGLFSASVLFNVETIGMQSIIDQVKKDWGIEIEDEATLNDGEAIRLSADQQLSITLSEGVLIDGNSLKISF